MPEGPKRSGHILTLEEESVFLEALPEHLADMTMLGLNTGLRNREIAGLRADQIHAKDGIDYIAIAAGDTKGKGDYVVPLNKAAAAVIERQPKHNHETVCLPTSAVGDRVDSQSQASTTPPGNGPAMRSGCQAFRSTTFAERSQRDCAMPVCPNGRCAPYSGTRWRT